MKNGTLYLILFDKRDDFLFSIVRMPFRTSDILTKTFNSAIDVELLKRVSKATSRTQNSLGSVASLLEIKYKLVNSFENVYGRYSVMKQFCNNQADFVS